MHQNFIFRMMLPEFTEDAIMDAFNNYAYNYCDENNWSDLYFAISGNDKIVFEQDFDDIKTKEDVLNFAKEIYENDIYRIMSTATGRYGVKQPDYRDFQRMANTILNEDTNDYKWSHLKELSTIADKASHCENFPFSYIVGSPYDYRLYDLESVGDIECNVEAFLIADIHT